MNNNISILPFKGSSNLRKRYNLTILKLEINKTKRRNIKFQRRSRIKVQAIATNSKLTELISRVIQIQIPVNTAVGLIIFSAAAPWIWDYLYNNYLVPIRCKICYGGGALICQQCQGRGKTGGWIVGQELCKCEKCQGRGKVKCDDCSGTGLWNNWLYTPSDDPGWGPRGNK